MTKATNQRRRGLGPVKHGNTYGVLVYASLPARKRGVAVDASTTACLGRVGGEVWTRPGVVTEHHRDRPLVERESRRWRATAERAREVLQPAAIACPREAARARHAAVLNASESQRLLQRGSWPEPERVRNATVSEYLRTLPP